MHVEIKDTDDKLLMSRVRGEAVKLLATELCAALCIVLLLAKIHVYLDNTVLH